MKTISREVDLESFTRFGLIFTDFPNLLPLPSDITPDVAGHPMNSRAAVDELFLWDWQRWRAAQCMSTLGRTQRPATSALTVVNRFNLALHLRKCFAVRF